MSLIISEKLGSTPSLCLVIFEVSSRRKSDNESAAPVLFGLRDSLEVILINGHDDHSTRDIAALTRLDASKSEFGGQR